MAKELRVFFLFFLGLCGTIAGIPQYCYSQSAGDVAFVGFNPVDKNTPDTPFLGAVATAADVYNGPQGTLTNTGLTPGTTAILPADNIDNVEYTGNRRGNTPGGYFNLLNDAGMEDDTDDNRGHYNGSDIASFLPFNDDDTSGVMINEILYDPAGAGDANGDGTVNDGDEFIEIVNNSGNNLDISNWTISDSDAIRFTFPEGTVLSNNNNVLVVFDEPAQGTGYGAAALYSAGSLSLNNGGDAVFLRNAVGNLVATVGYGGGDINQSLTRSPDISGSLVEHSDPVGSVGNFSPGTKLDGTAFSSTYAIALRDSEGWRMIATPSENTTFSDLFSGLWMQGVAGSDAPGGAVTLYSWDETTTTFIPVGSMGDNLEAGKGYIVYAFEDDQFSTPGLQGGFPKIVNVDNAEHASPVSVPVTATDSDTDGIITTSSNEGWNMLGNPFGTNISVTAVKDALEAVNTNLNANVAVWDHTAGSGNGSYVQLNDGDFIAPFQAFWIRYTQPVTGNASFDRTDLAANRGAVFYDKPAQPGFEIYLGDGDKFDKYSVSFRQKGTIGEDLQDAYKLFSLNAESINLFSTVGQGVKLAVNALPPVEQLDQEIRIPVRYQLPHAGEYTFTWDEMEALPPNIDVHLIDNQTGKSINLKTGRQFSFYYRLEEKQKFNTKTPFLNKTTGVKGASRFELLITPKDMVKELNDEMVKPVTLSPNFPNPFSNSTEMTIKLREPTRVTITIWNIVGQKVDTIMEDEMVSYDSYTYTWNADADLPSGIYICKLEAAGEVLIRKMTLIK